MAVRRTPRPGVRVIAPVFDIPEGLEDLVYDEDSDDLTADDDLEDYVEADDKNPKKKKKKKKKKKRKKKRKKKGKGKKKNKGKKKGKKGKGKKDKDNDGKGGKRDLNTPGSLEIVKQVIRTKKDGSQVVDVTVDVDKISRADKYEFRITKKDTGKTTVVDG
jgi:transposase